MSERKEFEKAFPKPVKFTTYHEQNKLFSEWHDIHKGWEAAWQHQQQRLAELQQQSAMQQREIMRLREFVQFYWDNGITENLYYKARDLLSTPANYDDLMAWHKAQLSKTVYVSHYSEQQEQVEGGCTIPVMLRKDK